MVSGDGNVFFEVFGVADFLPEALVIFAGFFEFGQVFQVTFFVFEGGFDEAHGGLFFSFLLEYVLVD